MKIKVEKIIKKHKNRYFTAIIVSMYLFYTLLKKLKMPCASRTIGIIMQTSIIIIDKTLDTIGHFLSSGHTRRQ